MEVSQSCFQGEVYRFDYCLIKDQRAFVLAVWCVFIKNQGATLLKSFTLYKVSKRVQICCDKMMEKAEEQEISYI